MKNPLRNILKPIKEVQLIRGIELPVGLEFKQLVVTGPPGAGKTYYINQIRGWPNEGYIDLTKKGWWRDQTLIYRPREVHLGLPYKGFDEALTVFDQEWLDTPSEALILDLQRIRIPPKGENLLLSNWRDRYIFEFLIPDPQQVYEHRLNRQQEGYFPVDDNLSLEMVSRQTDAYGEVALYLHRAGVNVYIRSDIHQPPMLITEKGDVALPPWAVVDVAPRPNLKTLSGWKQFIFKTDKIPWFTLTNELQELKCTSRIPHDGKSLDLSTGSLHLRIAPEIPLGATKKHLRLHKNWIISQPESCTVKDISGFARIAPGETVIIGRSNKNYVHLFDIGKPVAKRQVSISNIRGDLLISPLEREIPIKLVRLDDLDNREQIAANRFTAMLETRELLDGKVIPLEPVPALALINEINDILATEPFRPLDDHSRPGGLLELPPEPTPVIIGDLHAQVNNLLKILTENCLFEALEVNKACLCILGDGVHSENAQEMENMESSILMMDLIFALKRKYPANIFYLRGNHDNFSPEVSKQGIPQGLLLKKALLQTRGPAYVTAMEMFYSRLPYVIHSASFIACHAGPPRMGTTRKQIINISDFPQLADQLTKNRLKRPHYLGGYGKAEIKAFRKTFQAPKSTPIIVGHTPLDPFGSIWQNVGTIKNHHIVSSCHEKGPGFFIRIRNKMVPLQYPAEPLLKLISKVKSAD